ncbi:uncharacterized protein [Choristoneura fumiferana]|uniref:uncharacterized protein n=1 Tax=Choristoneura fumiferana TaxID=7141 RepID=UPI003D158D71
MGPSINGNIAMIKISRFDASYEVGEHYDTTISYQCDSCDLTDILCNGESVLAAGRVSIVSVTKMISFNFPRFEDAHSCVYLGLFKHKDKVYTKVLAVIETVKITNQPKLKPPQEGEQWQQEINFICEDCNVDKVYVNGMKLDTDGGGAVAFFVATSSTIDIRITAYTDTYLGVYQAKFQLGDETCTKNIMELLDEASDQEASTAAADGDQTTSDGSETTEGGGADASTAPDGETTAAPAGDETTAEGGGEATTAGGEGEETTAQALAAEGTEVTESGITVAADVAVTQADDELNLSLDNGTRRDSQNPK